jgi:RNA polymerase sigma-70 factor, ECF subfamily
MTEGMQDDLLVQQAQAGSQEAFCELVERHHVRAVNIALGMLGNVDEAKDVSQEAFVKAYRALHRFRREAKFRTWLYRIVMNECHNMLRKRQRAQRWFWSPTVAETESMEAVQWIELLPSTDRSSLDETSRSDEARVLQRAMTRLSPQQRTAVTLRYLQEMSVQEVAEIMGCATGTVQSQLARALRHLRVHMTGVIDHVRA